jgi:hypothetical protein
MKKLLILIGALTVIVGLLYSALFIFVNSRGKDILINSIRDNLGKEATVDSLSFKFPLNIEIKNFNSEGIYLQEVNASLGIPNIFNPGLILNSVYIDGFRLDITQESSNQLKSQEASKDLGSKNLISAQASGLPVSSKNKKFSLFIKKFNLKNGRLKYTYLKGQKPIIISFDDVLLTLKNFSYPKLSKFYIELKASLLSLSGDKKMPNAVALDGWVDYFSKNMDITLKLNSLDYSAFSQYYRDSWQPKKVGIERAIFSVDSSLAAINNELIIDSLLSLDTITFAELSETDEAYPRMRTIKTILALLKEDGDKITKRLVLKRKMYPFAWDYSSIKKEFIASLPLNIGIFIQEAVDTVGGKIPKEIGDTKEETIDQTIDKFKKIGEDIADTFKDIFKGKY